MLGQRHTLRLGVKLQLLLAAGVLVTLAGVLAIQTTQRVSDTYAERRGANLQITQVMAGPLSSALPLADPAAIYGYMEILDKNPTAAAVVIVKDGTVIKSQQSLDYLDLPTEVLEAVALEAAAASRDRVVDQGDFEFVGVPVVDSAERVMGAFAIGWSTKGLYGRIWRDALVQAGAIALVGVALLWVLGRGVRRLVTAPLGHIAAAVASEAEETTRDPLVLGHAARGDEICMLARAVGRFQERAAEVRRLNAHFQAALGNMSQGLCLFDAQGRLVVHNPRFAAMFGAPAAGATAATLERQRAMGGMF